MKLSLTNCFFFLIVFALFSCDKDQSFDENIGIDGNIIKSTITKVDDWVEIKIPNKNASITAIYGNIDDTLIVARLFDILITTDKGKTWNIVAETKRGISGITRINNELCALSTFSVDKGLQFSSSPFFFSQDNGVTWGHEHKYNYEVYDKLMVVTSKVNLSDDKSVEYRSDQEFQHPKYPSQAKPDLLIMNNAVLEYELEFPFLKQISYLYRDTNGILYVGARGVKFEPDYSEYNFKTETGTVRYPTSENVCYLYYKKIEASN